MQESAPFSPSRETEPGECMLILELACRSLKSSPALPLWLKLVELNGLPESQKRGYVFARQKWLAKELGYSSKPKGTFRNGARTVQRHLNDLHALGLIHWRRAGRGRNNYFLDPASVKETRRLYGSPRGAKIATAPAPHDASNVASPGQNVASETTKMSPPLHAEIKDNELREQGSSSVAAAAEKEKAKEDKTQLAFQIFAGLGIPDEKVRELVAAVRPHVAKDPDLSLEIAYHCQERLADKSARPVENWTGYVIRAFQDPGGYSILQIDGVWKRPTPMGPRKPSLEDRAKADAELRRQREEAAKRDGLFRAMPIRTMNREVTPCPK
jgi:hypothetical protein